MKFIHLSDLHIGKRVNEFSMLEDQKYILEKILETAEAEAADGVILAGDLYDKPVPPAEAVRVLDAFLTRLAEMGMPVFAVSGNHDSAERVAFGAQLFSGRGVYVSPVYDGKVEYISLRDSFGEVRVYLLPFVKPAVVRHVFEEEEIDSYQDAVRAAVEHMEVDPAVRNVLVAHQFVTGAARCESEEILVGGLDNVDAAVFDQFDYVALGHIHSPQHVGRETVRYCGTTLKYSFSEAGQEKSVTVVELGDKGDVGIRKIPLKPLRDMRRIRGSYMEVTDRAFYQDMNMEDYVQITLTDEEDVPDGMQKLRVIYPNLMRLEYDNTRTRESGDVNGACEVEQKSELELFGEFYELQNNQAMSGKQEAFVRRLIEEVQERQR
ncbi:exonuclease SbcCD subunit D [Schaedlerella arabinosiphila]|uniref:Nuclease SbcCD subunit D n=1 Tax=Schaedlerella arabinosiphila TaxID=2044587 RepID=A0A9X5C8S3_9FIRM|nr:exonuclease SbcCD subunit D [Schaedlerella arabinosiphila]NDO69718.1 exonuclease SbcCD subunit D [Schaedlerella arabinosiphila]